MTQSLENLLNGADNPVTLLRNSQIGAYVYPVVPTEFSNWRTEQEAWRETAVLFDQSHHMAEITIKGPDALKLCSYATINSFTISLRARPSRWCRPATTDTSSATGFSFICSRTNCCSWDVRRRSTGCSFIAETGGFNVDVIRDDRSPSHPNGKAVTRRHYPVSGPGTESGAGAAEVERRSVAGDQVLQLRSHQHQRA